MDYDDNEFQDQNCLVGGEGSSKFSPLLHSYALSKFDFDDGLQGHLRFDSLVENEVFLGIQSQEDNQWIEDFSRGSGVFSSSAPEPCPILRSNNVWSEAASSESVEMLLKSLGQEETVAILERSDASQKLHCEFEQMESHFNEDDNTNNVMDSDHTILPEKIADHGSELINVEGAPNCLKTESITHEKSLMLTSNALSEPCVVYGAGDNLDRRDGEKNVSEVDTSLDKFPFNETHDPCGSNMHTEDEDSLSQDINANTGGSANQETITLTTNFGFDKANCLMTDSVKEVKEDNVVGKEIYVDDQPVKETAYKNLKNLCSSSSNSEFVGLRPVESNISKLGKPSSSTVTENAELHIAEDCDVDVRALELNKGSECDHVDSSDTTQIDQQLDEDNLDALPGDFQGDVAHVVEFSTESAELHIAEDCDVDVRASELNKGSECDHVDSSDTTQIDQQLEKAAISSGLELKMCPTIEVTNTLEEGKVLMQGSDFQIGTEVSISGNQVSALSNLNDKISDTQIDENSINFAVGQEREHSIKNSIFGDCASVVHIGSNASNAEDSVTSPTVSGLAPNLNHLDHDQVVCSNAEEKPMFPNDSNEMECEVIEPLDQEKGVVLSFNGGSSEINEDAVRGSDCDAATSIEPVVTAETSPLFHERDAHVDLATDQMGKNSEIGNLGKVGTNLIPVKDTSQSTYHTDPVLEISKASPSTEKLPLEAADHSSPVGGTLTTPSESEQTGVVMKITADSDVPMPTISCNVLNASNCEKGETIDKSLVKSVPPSGSVESAFNEARQSDIAKNDRSIRFEVHLSSGVVGDHGQDQRFFPTTQSSQFSKSASPSTPSVGPMESKIISSRASSQALDVEIAYEGSTGASARKRARSSGKAPGKQSAKRRNSLKETTSSRESDRGDNKSNVSTSLSGTGNLQFEGVKLHEKFEQSNIVSCSGVLVAAPSLPDLNTSASPSALVRQPFSDMQQMQLRAQIFVYGSLIQGAAPDETCMVAAFGASDGGRSMWEPVWRAFVEKIQGAEFNLSKTKNPLQLLPGPSPSEQTLTKKDSLQNTVILSPVGRASFKNTPSPVSNSTIPLSSPLWNVATPFHGRQSSGLPKSSVFDSCQTLSPAYPFQTPSSRSVAGNDSSLQDHAFVPAPWINASQSSPFNGSARLPINETMKFTPIKESVPPVASGANYLTPSSAVHHSDPSVSAEPSPLPDVKKTALPFVGSGAKHSIPSNTVHYSGPNVSSEHNSLPDVWNMTLPSGQKTAKPQSRKRKKSTVSENLIQTPLLAQTQTESVPALVPLFAQARNEFGPAPVSTPVVPSHFSTSVVVSTPPFFGSKGNDVRTVTTASPSYSYDQPKRIEPNTEQKIILPEDASIKAEAAKQQAEDAAALATAAVSHIQTIWDQMNKQNFFGLIPEFEAKLASAAGSVAKAAAAAAEVALNAASQAKIMADEAWISTRVDNPALDITSSISNMGNNSMELSIASQSIPKVVDEGNFSSSILVAAKEAAKKRIEAASFASKRAENLDAIVKAAELAAAAVSQAGRIVAMGDPPSVAKLVEAGPEGYWRAPQVRLQQPHEECSNVDCIPATPNVYTNKEPSQNKAKTSNHDISPFSRGVFKDSVGFMPTFVASTEKDSRAQMDFIASDLDKTIGVVPESESGSRPTCSNHQDDFTKGVQTLKETSIKEGSTVEVKKEGNGFKEAWFSANVLCMESGKAFVCYAAGRSGSPQIKEWISLEGDDTNNAPRIRLSPRVTDVHHEGSKKRRRGAIGDYEWFIGDTVDVWIKKCWREGVITDKNEMDSTTLTVQFPAEGQTSVVRAWHLRPTLIWKDGEWIESSSSRQRDPLHKGDTPQEKRLKLGGPSIEENKKDMSKKNQLPGPERSEVLQLLPLSDNEKRFNVGNNLKKDNKLDAPRTVRSGLQKDGNRVVFGIPKPGKKNKFMEVSKHNDPETSNKTDKLKEKYSMPKNDAKEKQQGDLMTRVPKPGKPISSFGRTLSQKDKFPSSAVPTKNEAKKCTSTDGSEPEKQKRSELVPVSSTDRAAQGSFVFSSSALSRNMFTSNARSERAKRVNRAPIVSKSKGAKDHLDAGKHIPEMAEPRRSNRRIQPTSRLLEGLQSSLILPKSPSFAHDKGHRSQNRSTPKGK